MIHARLYQVRISSNYALTSLGHLGVCDRRVARRIVLSRAGGIIFSHRKNWISSGKEGSKAIYYLITPHL